MKIVYAFYWKSDFDAGHRIESLEEINHPAPDGYPYSYPLVGASADNPESPCQWTGFDTRNSAMSWTNQLTMLRQGSRNYSSAALDELGIPRYEGFSCPEGSQFPRLPPFP